MWEPQQLRRKRERSERAHRDKAVMEMHAKKSSNKSLIFSECSGDNTSNDGFDILRATFLVVEANLKRPETRLCKAQEHYEAEGYGQ